MKDNNYKLNLEYIKDNLNNFNYSKLEVLLIDKLLDFDAFRNINEYIVERNFGEKSLYNVNISYNGNSAKLTITNDIICLQAENLDHFRKVIPHISKINCTPSMKIENEKSQSLMWFKNPFLFYEVAYAIEDKDKKYTLLKGYSED